MAHGDATHAAHSGTACGPRPRPNPSDEEACPALSTRSLSEERSARDSRALVVATLRLAPILQLLLRARLRNRTENLLITNRWIPGDARTMVGRESESSAAASSATHVAECRPVDVSTTDLPAQPGPPPPRSTSSGDWAQACPLRSACADGSRFRIRNGRASSNHSRTAIRRRDRPVETVRETRASGRQGDHEGCTVPCRRRGAGSARAGCSSRPAA
jgi:hypothetical protein